MAEILKNYTSVRFASLYDKKKTSDKDTA